MSCASSAPRFSRGLLSTSPITREPRRHRSQAGRTRARFVFEALEDRCLLSGISGVTEYSVPNNHVASQIAQGPDGNLWFTEFAAGSKIGMINPTTHEMTEFTPPTANSNPYGITAGPDGNVWFTEWAVNKIGVINPSTHTITEFALPSGYTLPRGIAVGPDGNLWFAETSDAIGMISPTTHVIREFPIGHTSAPFAIVAGPDGNIWFTEWSGGRIGFINPTTHSISEFPAINGTGSKSYSITVGPDGNLWFPATAGNGNGALIGTISSTTYSMTSFPVPTGNSPYAVATGPDGNLWFTDGQIGRLALTTGVITEYPIATGQGITTGPDDNLWFTGGSGGVGGSGGGPYIGVPSLTDSQLAVTQQPPSGVTAGSSFGVSFQAQDSFGNPITSFNGPVTIGLANNPAGDTLGGTLTVNASGGVATFSGLTLTKAATDTLYASGGGYGWGVTNPITVTPASPSQLVITQQPPATVKVSTAFGLQATIEDQYGNVVTTASNAVSVAFANNPTGATLGGTLSVTASQGVATFSNLTINKTGSGYTLRVSGGGLTSAVTSAINVTKTGKAAIHLAPAAPAAAPDPILVPLVFDSPDLWDGARLRKRVWPGGMLTSS